MTRRKITSRDKNHPYYKDFKKWHWNIEPEHLVSLEDGDPRYPEWLTECGRLVEIHLFVPGNSQRRARRSVLKLNAKEREGSHLAYDKEHPSDRLYVLSDPAFKARMKRKYRRNPQYAGGTPFDSTNLNDMSELVGGRHGTDDYPDIDVVPMGIVEALVYGTEKKGDGYSWYIHKMGEESGIKPAMGVATDGTLWLAGGNYTAPVPGITD